MTNRDHKSTPTLLYRVATLLAVALIGGFANGATTSYTYDSLNRLTKADYGGGLEISYTYDAAGNRLTYSDIDTTPYVDTTVVAWGYNTYSQTNVPAGLSSVAAVAGGGYHN